MPRAILWKVSSCSLGLLLLGVICASSLAVDINGAANTTAGYGHVFSLDRQAEWLVVPSPPDGQSYIIPDTAGKSVTFASPKVGNYQLIAAYINDNGNAAMSVHTFTNIANDEDNNDGNNLPTPEPRPSTLALWIQQNAPTTDSLKLKKIQAVYSEVAVAIKNGAIQSPISGMTNIVVRCQPLLATAEDLQFQTGLADWLEKLYSATPTVEQLQIFCENVAQALEQTIKKQTAVQSIEQDCPAGNCPTPSTSIQKSKSSTQFRRRG